MIPENIHTPPHPNGWSMEIPKGWGGSKGWKFLRGMGGMGPREEVSTGLQKMRSIVQDILKYT